MKKLLTILLLSFSLITKAQTFSPSPGNNITVTIGGSTYKAFCPSDYLTCDPSDLYFHVFFHGDGTTASGSENQVMGKWIKAGGPWNGRVLLNNGDTARVIILSIPDYTNQPTKYGHAIKTAIQSFTRLATDAGGNTSIPGHFSMAGLSGGPGRAHAWQVSDTTVVRTLFKRGVFMSPVFHSGNMTWSSGGNWFIHWNRLDPNGGTPPSAAIQWYNDILGTKDTLSVAVPGCHCNTIWDSCMTVVGLDSHTGGTAATNRIRRLIDPTDGLGGPNLDPVADAGPDQSITLPVNGVTVNGSGSSDPDGTITTYLWTKISGPSNFTITNPNSVSTTITGLVQGVYVFRLTVTDNNGAQDSDDMQVTVNAAVSSDIVIGQQRRRIVSGKELLYFAPDTSQRPTLKQFFVLNVVDSTGKDSAYAALRNGLVKKINNGWNGLQPLPNGDTMAINVVTQISDIDVKNTIEIVLQWALDSLPNQCFDTSNRARNIMTGGGLGAQRQLYYLLDKYSVIFQGGTLKFKDNFLNFTAIDMFDADNLMNTNGWANMKQPFKSWWWSGSIGGYPYLPSFTQRGYDSASQRNGYPNSKRTVVTGQGYSQVTRDSVYSTLGTNSFNNVMIWWADTVVDTDYGLATPINVDPNDVYDLVQAVKTADKLFDGNLSTSYINNFFEGQIITAFNHYGVIVDLKNYITHPKIEVYNNSNGGNTVYFQFLYDYTDTSRASDIFPIVLPDASWKWVDSTLTRFYSDSARFLKIIVQGSYTAFAEVKVYGVDLGPAPSMLPDPLPRPSDPGILIQGFGKVFPENLTDDAGKFIRIQNTMEWIDTLTGTNFTDGRTIWDNIFSNSANLTYIPTKAAGRKMWPYYANQRINFTGPGGTLRKDIPFGADSTDEASWEFVKRTHYGMAAKFGYNTSADLTGYTFFNTNPGAGLGFFDAIEIGNEDAQHWNGMEKFHDVVSLLLKHKAGYEGAKAGDPNIEVISGALTGLRWDRLRAQYLTNLLRFGSKDYPADAIAINEYSTTAGGQHGGSPPYDGITPEKFDLYNKLDSTRKLVDKYYPGRKIYITEFGYDGDLITDLTSAPWIDTITNNSNYNVTDVPNQTRDETKAYWTMRWYELGAAAHMDKMVQYTQRTLGGGDFGTTGFNYGFNLRAPGQDILPAYMEDFVDAGRWVNGGCCVVLPTDLYWHMVLRIRVLENYKAWPQIIQNGDSTGLWVLKYSHLTRPDSTVYSIWYGTDIDSSNVVNLNIPNNRASQALAQNPIGTFIFSQYWIKPPIRPAPPATPFSFIFLFSRLITFII